MNIASLLARKGTKVVTIRPEERIRQVVRLFAEHNIGALVVVGLAGKAVGIITERGITREAVKNEGVFAQTVESVMAKEVIIGQPHDDLMSVAHTMTEKRIRHLPVIDGGKLVGIVSIGDVLKAQRDKYAGEVETLQTQLLESQP